MRRFGKYVAGIVEMTASAFDHGQSAQAYAAAVGTACATFIAAVGFKTVLDWPWSYFWSVAVGGWVALSLFVVAPYRLWSALEQQRERGNSERSRALARLRELRKSGVPIRNEGLNLPSLEAANEWVPRIRAWREEVMSEAARVDPNLHAILDTLDVTTDAAPLHIVFVRTPEQALYVRVASSILARLQEHIEKQIKVD